MRRFGLSVAFAFVIAFVLLSGPGSDRVISLRQMVTAPYQFNLVTWEVGHFLDKWLYHLGEFFTGGPMSSQERRQAVVDYFERAQEIGLLRQQLERDARIASEGRTKLAAEVDELEQLQRKLKPGVEATLEGLIDRELDELGISGRLGPFRWPPVDFVLTSSPLLLVTSRKDRVERSGDVLLRSGVELTDRETLEGAIEQAEQVSALVVGLGGVATYPAHISPTGSLHHTLVIASHEWIHHYLFFRPLGFGQIGGGGIVSINETVANIAGEEIGDRLFTKLTGQTVERLEEGSPSPEVQDHRAPDAFDFRREMRETRLGLDRLLAEGRVEEAEVYLERRRQLFVQNGYYIRKLNTAYFAFYGTYADNPASVSVIEPQLRTVRDDAGDLATFLNKVSQITTERQLEMMAREAGWEPDND